MVEELINFLRARLAEDERAARLMNEFYPSPWELSDRGWMARVMADGPVFREVTCLEQWPTMPTGEGAPWLSDIVEHIARHDPQRVLAEINAKRQILRNLECAEIALRNTEDGTLPRELMTGSANSWRQAVRLLALPYANRPGYREEWRP